MGGLFRNLLREDVGVGIRDFIWPINHGNASVDTKMTMIIVAIERGFVKKICMRRKCEA